MDNMQLVNNVITLIDQLVIQGARNASIVTECIKQLGQLRQNLSEVKEDVQNQAK